MPEKSIRQTESSVTVVGAGLVGSLLSIMLSRQGYRVTVLERRPDIRKTNISAGRSINLAISARGLYALKEVGLESQVSSIMIPMYGRMIHSKSGETNLQAYGKDNSEHINSISRGDLNRLLLDFAERSGNVVIQFGSRIVGYDLNSGALSVEDENTRQVSSLSIPTVFGSDGSSSAIRSSLLKETGFAFSEDKLPHGYKELTLPAGKKGEYLIEKNALHIWPRQQYMLIALPNSDGSFTCTLFFPFKGEKSFETLDSKTKVRSFFEGEFSDFTQLVPDLEDQFFGHPTGEMVTVRCFPWNYSNRALLLGDAAHAIVPFFGQGMNCGFEDVSVLGELLSSAGTMPTHLAPLFSDFCLKRKANADAIALMAVENFIEMRDKTRDPRFIISKGVEKILSQTFPDRYVPRYSLVSFSRVPYLTAYQVGIKQKAILEELCRGVSDPNKVDLERAARLVKAL